MGNRKLELRRGSGSATGGGGVVESTGQPDGPNARAESAHVFAGGGAQQQISSAKLSASRSGANGAPGKGWGPKKGSSVHHSDPTTRPPRASLRCNRRRPAARHVAARGAAHCPTSSSPAVESTPRQPLPARHRQRSQPGRSQPAATALQTALRHHTAITQAPFLKGCAQIPPRIFAGNRRVSMAGNGALAHRHSTARYPGTLMHHLSGPPLAWARLKSVVKRSWVETLLPRNARRRARMGKARERRLSRGNIMATGCVQPDRPTLCNAAQRRSMGRAGNRCSHAPPAAGAGGIGESTRRRIPARPGVGVWCGPVGRNGVAEHFSPWPQNSAFMTCDLLHLALKQINLVLTSTNKRPVKSGQDKRFTRPMNLLALLQLISCERSSHRDGYVALSTTGQPANKFLIV